MNFFRGVLQDLKLLFEDISDRGRFPRCRVERTDGYASCAHCGRWLKHIVWVEGVPYGSTCYAKAGRAFEQAREAQLEARGLPDMPRPGRKSSRRLSQSSQHPISPEHSVTKQDASSDMTGSSSISRWRFTS